MAGVRGWWWAVPLAALAAGCGKGGGLLVSPCQYQLLVVNRTHRDFYNVSVYFGPKTDRDQYGMGPNVATSPGALYCGGVKGDYPLSRDVPDEATVEWVVDVDGLGTALDPPANHPRHSAKVKLAGIVPRKPDGKKVYILINEDNTASVAIADRKDHDAIFNIEMTSEPYLPEETRKLWKKNRDDAAAKRK